jgi:Domain of unknown function (DUF4351)
MIEQISSLAIAWAISLKRGEHIDFEDAMQNEHALIMRQLTRRVGEVPADLSAQIEALPPAQLEDLAEALLDFTSLLDLRTWLEENPDPYA